MRKYLTRLYWTFGGLVIALIIIFTQGGFTQWQQGLDLAGGVRLLYLMDFSQYRKNYKTDAAFDQQRKNVINIVKKNIDGRISKLGVSDYNARYVVLGGKDYIEIELGGIKDIEKAKKTIGKTVQMTFKVPYEGDITPEIKAERQLLAEKILTMVVSGDEQNLKDYLTPPRAWNIYTNVVAFSGDDLKKTFGNDIEQALTTGYVYPKLLEGNVQVVDVVKHTLGETVPSYDIYKFLGKQDGKYVFQKISVAMKPSWVDAKEDGKLLNGERFQMATVSRAPSGESAVSVQFDNEGRKIFSVLTKKYLHKPMAIFVGNKLMTDPTIQSEIPGGVAQITGRYTPKTAAKLAEDLNTGAMPVPLKLQQEEKVSPTLGAEAFRNAFIAGGVGLLFIFILFWIFYGFRYALVTLISLGIFFIALGAFIKLFGVILSLSAIGAILLNIGMAVDANVIIFERVQEEIQAGSSFLTAVEKGYENSLSAIRDGNLTTGLIAFLLFMIGTNIFKGFGTMMIINIFIVLVIMVPAIPGLMLLLIKKNK